MTEPFLRFLYDFSEIDEGLEVGFRKYSVGMSRMSAESKRPENTPWRNIKSC